MGQPEKFSLRSGAKAEELAQHVREVGDLLGGGVTLDQLAGDYIGPITVPNAQSVIVSTKKVKASPETVLLIRAQDPATGIFYSGFPVAWKQASAGKLEISLPNAGTELRAVFFVLQKGTVKR